MNNLKLTITLISLLACLTAKAQSDFKKFEVQQRMHMLRAYANNDPATYRLHFDSVEQAYKRLGGKPADYFWETACFQMDLYFLACTYARAGKKEEAIACLQRCDGYDAEDLMHDKDLGPLRGERAFQALVAEANKLKSNNLSILKSTPPYSNERNGKIPKFTYQDADNAHLEALRTKYNLDSIAGSWDDVNQIINLMKWVHYLIPHDGSKPNPDTRNAMALINTCKSENRTLNCWGLATVLNEVYLAKGFSSRIVTCLPKDKSDADCHVITAVWSPMKKKWLWMDPTFMAYVMDETGTLLSIEEVRDRLINDKMLILNPDANRNHVDHQAKQDYLGDYMAKNLYQLQSPLRSEYDYETRKKDRKLSYMQLVPPPAEKSMKTSSGYTYYYTSNPEVFWAPPVGAGLPKAVDTAQVERFMKNFKYYYNKGDTIGLANLFADPMANQSFISSLVSKNQKDCGKLISYKYLGQEDDIYSVFEMVYNNSMEILAIELDKAGKGNQLRGSTISSAIFRLHAAALKEKRKTK